MRIDKFLKVSRLIKRREIAKELCEAGSVSINGKKAKPMSEVNAGDELEIKLGHRVLTVKVNETREFASKEQAAAMFSLLNDISH